ncbi:Uncharacterised protein [BD1-7 clade bacterium]|uniref:Uncharacterized protein n=1 Tax=BD1-7 clade bacterium TaxID=2029982 RepID=A0A5S9NMP9_9GAMM|nr:Uncharacterised protein [BD1-7 clade bacterium]CAA0093562.1 Uncharacterised protein [BD1-7 clade bacterium]
MFLIDALAMSTTSQGKMLSETKQKISAMG